MSVVKALLKETVNEFRNMKVSDHLLYWGYPFSICIIYMGMYFFGPYWMQELAAPSSNREFGLIENTQHVIILITIVTVYRLMTLAPAGIYRIIYLAILAASVFIFLEEIDYGMHYVEYFRETPDTEKATFRNLHNHPHVSHLMILFGYCLMGLFIFIFPRLKSIHVFKRMHWFFASLKLQFSVYVLLLISNVVYAINLLPLQTNHSLLDNISEFEELPVYYLILVYFYEQLKGARAAKPPHSPVRS
ncbi:MAG TPA: hypothetical protein PLD84_02485 [Chitinophagales bacterium]|nr:hypothetical protein [Chitinophagales bacterium]